jgi:hypothetical protein
LIGAKIGEEVHAHVEEGEEAEHAAETDEVRKVEELAKGSDAQGEDEETKGPVTGGMLKKFDGIGAQVVVKSAIDETDKWEKTDQEDDHFGPFTG